MNTAIFRRSWINTGLVDENELNEEVDEFEEYDVASSLLEKEEEEELIEHFLAQWKINSFTSKFFARNTSPLSHVKRFL
jgi:hypothetical protein